MNISIIVPTLNEEETIEECLTHLQSLNPFEIIVVDAQSRDATQELAHPLADQVLEQTGGLAYQLNLGAKQAQGEVLLFNYSDTRLNAESLRGLTQALLTEPDLVGGAFELELDSPSRGFKVVSVGGNFRNRFGIGPFGDQSIFVKKEIFDSIGGYDPDAFLEDQDLVQRIKKAGRFTILPLPARTSVRRWQEKGFYKTLFVHWYMTALYILGKRKKGKKTQKITEHLRSRRNRPDSKPKG